MQVILWTLAFLLMAYLIGQLAYRKGRQDKWEEISKDYICLHKGVVVSRVKVRKKIAKDIQRAEKRCRARKRKQNLDKIVKKRYNK